MIKSSERYLSLLYDRMHQQIYQGPVIHADETPVKVKRDGRDTMCNSYMWVYRTGTKDGQQPVILYEYQKTRNSSHPAEFLKGYEGTMVLKHIIRLQGKMQTSQLQAAGRMQGGNMSRSVKH